MNKDNIRCVLISDFNLDVFAGYLSNDEKSPAVNATAAPFGQVIPLLMQEDLTYWQGGFDLAVIWTRPEAVIESFNNLLAGKSAPIDEIMGEVD